MIYSEYHKSSKIASEYNSRFEWLPLKTQQHGERRIIKQVLKKIKPNVIVDLACGTGRILKMIEDVSIYENIEIIGVDCASEMLEIAHNETLASKLIHLDFLDRNLRLEKKADLVTCFRLFANAEPELRTATLRFTLQHLEHGGYFLMNNHKSSVSISNRLLRRKYPERAFGVREQDIFESDFLANFELIKCWSIGIVPQHEVQYFKFSNFSAIIDRILSNLAIGKFGVNNIYLFKKK